nr:MerR family transcriptional regulator [Oxobacter pfennigii]
MSEFAQKHNISQSTVRHYIDFGLLVAQKNGSHYRFHEDDSRDIERIMNLKQLDFSLPEIQKILTFQRLTGGKADEYKKMYLSLLESKEEQIIQAQQKYEKMSYYLKETINSLKSGEMNRSGKLGFPLSSVGMLQCPCCGAALNISAGTIENNMLIEGSIKCKCGYSAIIQDGIYIDEKAARQKLLYGKPMPDGKEYLRVASPGFINFRYKGMGILIDSMHKHCKEPEYIMEFNLCVGYFLNQYIKHIPGNAIYILVDYDKDRIAHLKSSLETGNEHKNFIFLCCDVDGIPLRNSSIDIIIDYWMTKDFAQSNNQPLLDIVLPFLKHGGLLAGIYPNLHKVKGIDNTLPQIEDYFNREKILKKLTDLNLKQLDVADMGPVIEKNRYNMDIYDREIYQTIYVGKK